MKKILLISLIYFLGNLSAFAQNVGIGTTTPTNTLHIVGTGSTDPLKIEGLQMFTNETDLLIVNPITGIVRYIAIDSLQTRLNSTNFDSIIQLTRDSLLNDTNFLNSINTDDQNLTLSNDTLFIEGGNWVVIPFKTDTALIDSLILSNYDSLYTIITDSLSNDSLWIKQIDSLLSIYGDTIYFNDSSFTLTRDSLLKNSAFIDSLISLIGDSINTDLQDIDSLTVTGTNLTVHIENGNSATVNLQPMIDSLVLANADSLYSIITDSLSNDSLWIKQIDSLLSVYGDTIYFNDSSFALTRDSLLKNTVFIDSLISLIADSIDTDIDSLKRVGDSLFIYEDGKIVKGYIKDTTIFKDSIFTPQSVIFAGENGSLSEDTNDFYYDSSINKLTINSSVNKGGIDINTFHDPNWFTNVSTVTQGLSIRNYENILTGAPVLYFFRSRIDGNGGKLPLINKDHTAAMYSYTTGPNGSQIQVGPWIRQEVNGVNSSTNRYGADIVMRANDTTLGASTGADRFRLGYHNINFYNYPNTRVDTSVVNNFLYTDATGTVQSQSIDSIKSCNYEGRILYVSTAGNNATAQIGKRCYPFRDPWAAKDSAKSGDLIHVLSGTYSTGDIGSGADRESDASNLETTSLIKGKLSYNLQPEVRIVATSTTNGMPIFYSIDSSETNIHGKGKFIMSIGELIDINNQKAKLDIEFDSIKCFKIFNNSSKVYSKLHLKGDDIETISTGFNGAGGANTVRADVSIEIKQTFKPGGGWLNLSWNNANINMKFNKIYMSLGFDIGGFTNCKVNMAIEDFQNTITDGSGHGGLFDVLGSDSLTTFHAHIKRARVVDALVRWRAHNNDGNFYINIDDAEKVTETGPFNSNSLIHIALSNGTKRNGSITIEGNYNAPFITNTGISITNAHFYTTPLNILFKNVMIKAGNTEIGYTNGTGGKDFNVVPLKFISTYANKPGSPGITQLISPITVDPNL